MWWWYNFRMRTWGQSRSASYGKVPWLTERKHPELRQTQSWKEVNNFQSMPSPSPCSSWPACALRSTPHPTPPVVVDRRVRGGLWRPPDQTSSSVLERKVNIGHRRGAQRGQHFLLLCLHPIDLNPSAIPRIVCPGWTFMTLISLFKIFVSGIKWVCTFVIWFLSP